MDAAAPPDRHTATIDRGTVEGLDGCPGSLVIRDLLFRVTMALRRPYKDDENGSVLPPSFRRRPESRGGDVDARPRIKYGDMPARA